MMKEKKIKFWDLILEFDSLKYITVTYWLTLAFLILFPLTMVIRLVRDPASGAGFNNLGTIYISIAVLSGGLAKWVADINEALYKRFDFTTDSLDRSKEELVKEYGKASASILPHNGLMTHQVYMEIRRDSTRQGYREVQRVRNRVILFDVLAVAFGTIWTGYGLAIINWSVALWTKL